MPLLEFIPGIIIQGREWILVASAMDDKTKTVVEKVLGVYQTVCVLQHLKRCIEETYWPWYQQAVLCVPAALQGSDGL
ncbi:hypothetical protein ColLi_13120 [Colletotrichum liriopes]|uniref:PD-(D/E)XK nuclease-like domain-containing protein n=1 Tax=Colletotrichum liriopes TaxID=708192 RepID=A0AA37LZ88_9PEZI|nr:hypothetical protein ColLi_13120 [Colletotrichum liriopes]